VSASHPIKTVVLAGAQDWGHCPLRLATPRPLAPIANQPLLMHSFAALRRAGLSDVVLCANGYTRAFRRVFGDGSAMGVALHYSEDQMPRGPAGCVKDATDFLAGADVLVLEGGLIPDIDFIKLIAEHRRSNALVTVAVDNSVSTDGWHSGRWNSGFGPQPVGVYVFGPRVADYISPVGYQDIKEGLLPRLYDAGEKVVVATVDGEVPRVMGPESYLAINAWAVERTVDEHRELDGYQRIGDAYVHAAATIAPTARLVGPVIVGPDSTVGDAAVVIGPTTIGTGCEVGEHAVISCSALWDDVRVGAHAQVEQSIMAYGTSAPTGSQVFNTVCLDRALKTSERATLATRYEVGAAAVC